MALAAVVYSLSTRADSATLNTPDSLPPGANQYRSLPGIVWSCLTTIFLCIWVSLHLNIPEPVDTRRLNRFERFKFRIKSFIRCNVVPVLVTLLIPEWVLGMAVRQSIMASQVANEIDATRQQGFFIIMGGFHLFNRIQPTSLNESTERVGEETHPLVEKSALEVGDGRHNHAPSQKMATIFEEEFGEPVHPLDEVDVCHLIKAGKLRLPTSAELEDKCKSDGLAKFLVVTQTLWFIAQCIARKVSKLPLTELEVITLGYTLLTLSLYIAWWDKPYRVTFPIRVYEALPERAQGEILGKLGRVIGVSLSSIVGAQSGSVDLRSVKRVPMFHAGHNKGSSGLGGMVTAVLAGSLFGAVHCLAWSSPFSSSHIQYLWKFATIVMTVVPPTAVIGTIFVAVISDKCFSLAGLSLIFIPFLPILYLVGRAMTIILALKMLEALPLDAYRDVEWSDFFPHI
ncbi:SubName: Full=Uncharacterized protein {ECO:0000313/EMBL:CCA67555.1} [Serendipita indica DSM 11827]|nr:SubName: Full=Uncharacterized protein {ECO:0000313/EMBL:CCA67555.1} [Serendipita indica DSM 11827]